MAKTYKTTTDETAELNRVVKTRAMQDDTTETAALLAIVHDYEMQATTATMPTAREAIASIRTLARAAEDELRAVITEAQAATDDAVRVAELRAAAAEREREEMQEERDLARQEIADLKQELDDKEQDLANAYDDLQRLRQRLDEREGVTELLARIRQVMGDAPSEDEAEHSDLSLIVRDPDTGTTKIVH